MSRMTTELTKILNENQMSPDLPYDRFDDDTVIQRKYKRKKVLTLKDLNSLKRIRNEKREELAQDSIFIPYLYGPKDQEESGSMGGLGI